MTATISLLPGTQVRPRGLRWEVVLTQQVGPQTLVRFRGIEGALLGRELDLLHDFEPVEPIAHDFLPEKAGPLRNWLVYHQAFLLEQAIGLDAFTRKHDPYWDIPLKEPLPRPVIDLPVVSAEYGARSTEQEADSGGRKSGTGKVRQMPSVHAELLEAAEAPDECRLTSDPPPTKRRRKGRQSTR